MSSTLLRIYGFFIVLSLLVSNSLFTKGNPTINKVAPFSPTLQKQNLSNFNISPSLSTSTKIVSTSTEQNEIPTIIKTTIQSTTTPFVNTVVSTKISTSTQITEIDSTENDAELGVSRPNPCITPIAYSLGSFDTRFGISKNYFLETITEATTLWNNAAGKKLFTYSEQGGSNTLTINLIYDSRQQNTNDNKLLGIEIQNTKNAALALEREYEALKVTFSNLKDTYTQRVEDFNIRQKNYEDKVSYWNEQGGAPRGEYDVLTQEKEDLQKESDAITHDHDILNAMLVDINTKIDKHNELVSFANENVALNNSRAQKKFTEGKYSSGTNEISIYQFNDTLKLKRVLTHELGHALGIGHTTDKQSIMYAINSATTTTLQEEDIQALKDICSNN